MSTFVDEPADHPVGILLAAGAGRRMGMPKALVRDADGRPWLTRTAIALRDGGCAPVIVVLGASHRQAEALLHGLEVAVVVADDWASGMGASLRAGLRAAESTSADVALVTLVDLPDVGTDVITRLASSGAGPSSLSRAVYRGRPGHPVLLGRDHWAPVIARARGDKGARDYLAARRVAEVECSDLAGGRDVDELSNKPTGIGNER